MRGFFRKAMPPWRSVYYTVRPLVPRRVQIALRRWMVARLLPSCRHLWPIDERAGLRPPGWRGWPDGKRFALILTHDVESRKGHDRCRTLLALEEKLGFRSSFNFVPERYPVDPGLRAEITARGFEVGVHGLKHDGKLYQSREIFLSRAVRINAYLRQWGAVGFRSPAMHHNLDWLGDLDIQYDSSTFDTDPFEPQPDAAGTIFPFLVPRRDGRPPYLELPYTLPQDFTLFVLMKKKGPDLWHRKLDWIAQRGGMALVNTHPDYMLFQGTKTGLEEYPVDSYREFLAYAASRYRGEFWHGLPREMASWLLPSNHGEPIAAAQGKPHRLGEPAACTA